VGYALTRVQFGRVIGSFQALQDRLADLHVLVDSAVSLSRAASAEEGPGLGLRGRGGKVYCPAHRHLKRAHGALHLFGGSAQHTAAIAASLIDC